MKHVIRAVLLCTAAMLLVPVASYAKNEGYLVDRAGNIVTGARSGLCVRLARQWAPSLQNADCARKAAAAARGR